MRRILIISGIILFFSICFSSKENLIEKTNEKNFKIMFSKTPVTPTATRDTSTKTVENNPYKTVSQENLKKTEEMVYVTKSGKKYHHKGCGYLRSIGGSYIIEEAESRGYKPCSRF